MGRITTPRYVLKIVRHTCFGHSFTPMTWAVKDMGQPTVANIDKYVSEFEQSLVNGPNKHLGIFSLAECMIWDQKFKREVCRWVRREFRPNESPFQVVA